MAKVTIFILLVVPTLLIGLVFSEVEGVEIPNVSHGSFSWGDYNNDGLLDLLITGHDGSNPISQVYRNEGDSYFSLQDQILLTGVWEGKGVWGDSNNNGLLDILISGRVTGNQYITKLYLNNGDNSFTELLNSSFPGVRSANIDWVDYDNDGWLDLFIAGEAIGGRIARIYRNNQDNSFTWQNQFEFDGFTNGESSWFDFTNNGFKDLIYTGNGGNIGLITRIYINNEGNNFSIHTHNIPGFNHASLRWGDFDGDGFADLLITGTIDQNRLTRVYRSCGSGSFQLINEPVFTGITYGKAIWADLTNNGKQDIIIVGESGANQFVTKIYQNQGEGFFAELTGHTLAGVRNSSVAISDINNNGRTDIILSGLSLGGVRITKIYQSVSGTTNTVPLAPSVLNTIVNEDNVFMSWSNGFDTETATSGLSYNLVFRNIGSEEISYGAPMSCLVNGFRRVVGVGNAGFNNQISFRNLPSGYYQWAVQTIDSALWGSSFSSWVEFNVYPETLSAPTNLVLSRMGDNLVLSWNAVDFASGYRIEGSENLINTEWFILAYVTDTDWIVPEQGERYFFRVIAVP